MDQLFVNSYIEKAIVKITDLVKQDLMTSTQLDLAQQLINTLQKEKQQLVDENQKLQASLNKKASKQAKDDF